LINKVDKFVHLNIFIKYNQIQGMWALI